MNRQLLALQSITESPYQKKCLFDHTKKKKWLNIEYTHIVNIYARKHL